MGCERSGERDGTGLAVFQARMSTKLVLVTVLGAGALASAAAGGYLALRHNAADLTRAEANDAPTAAPAVMVETPEPAAPARAVEAARYGQAAEAAETRPAASPAAHAARPAPAARRGSADLPAVAAVPASDQAPAVPASTTASAAEPVRPELRDARAESAPAPVYEPARPRFEEVIVPADGVIGIRLESNISSETAQVEDRVVARITRDVTVNGQTAIASGTRLEGVVASVEQGGKFRDRARLGIRFQSIVLADGTRLPVETEMIVRESESPTASAATKVGASAAVGGILGAVIGGKKGAAIGAAVGAAGGSGAVMAGRGPAAVLTAGTPLTVRLTAPVTVTIQREDN